MDYAKGYVNDKLVEGVTKAFSGKGNDILDGVYKFFNQNPEKSEESTPQQGSRSTGSNYDVSKIISLGLSNQFGFYNNEKSVNPVPEAIKVFGKFNYFIKLNIEGAIGYTDSQINLSAYTKNNMKEPLSVGFKWRLIYSSKGSGFDTGITSNRFEISPRDQEKIILCVISPKVSGFHGECYVVYGPIKILKRTKDRFESELRSERRLSIRCKGLIESNTEQFYKIEVDKNQIYAMSSIENDELESIPINKHTYVQPSNSNPLKLKIIGNGCRFQVELSTIEDRDVLILYINKMRSYYLKRKNLNPIIIDPSYQIKKSGQSRKKRRDSINTLDRKSMQNQSDEEGGDESQFMAENPFIGAKQSNITSKAPLPSNKNKFMQYVSNIANSELCRTGLNKIISQYDSRNDEKSEKGSISEVEKEEEDDPPVEENANINKGQKRDVSKKEAPKAESMLTKPMNFIKDNMNMKNLLDISNFSKAKAMNFIPNLDKSLENNLANLKDRAKEGKYGINIFNDENQIVDEEENIMDEGSSKDRIYLSSDMISKLEAENKILKDRISMYTKEIEHAKKDNVELIRTNEHLQENIEKLTNQKAVIDEKMTSLMRERDDKVLENMKMKEDFVELKMKHESLLKSRELDVKRMNDLEEEIIKKNHEFDEMKAESRATSYDEREKSTMMEVITKLSEEKKELNLTTEKLKQRIEQLEEQNKDNSGFEGLMIKKLDLISKEKEYLYNKLKEKENQYNHQLEQSNELEERMKSTATAIITQRECDYQQYNNTLNDIIIRMNDQFNLNLPQNTSVGVIFNGFDMISLRQKEQVKGMMRESESIKSMRIPSSSKSIDERLLKEKVMLEVQLAKCMKELEKANNRQNPY